MELENFSFTVVDAEDYAALEQLQQIFICLWILAPFLSVK
jgi:hypothetical protein